MSEVSVYEARNNLSKLIREAQAGREVIITSRGRPVARLTAATRSTGADLITWMDTNPLLAGPGRSADEIEDSIYRERDSWT